MLAAGTEVGVFMRLEVAVSLGVVIFFFAIKMRIKDGSSKSKNISDIPHRFSQMIADFTDKR